MRPHLINKHFVRSNYSGKKSFSIPPNRLIARVGSGSHHIQSDNSTLHPECEKCTLNIPTLARNCSLSGPSLRSAYYKSDTLLSGQISTPLFPHVGRAISMVTLRTQLERKHNNEWLTNDTYHRQFVQKIALSMSTASAVHTQILGRCNEFPDRLSSETAPRKGCIYDLWDQ